MLEAKLKASNAILYIQVKRCLASSPSQDINHLFKAAEKEGLLCLSEGGGVTVGWSNVLGLPLCFHSHFSHGKSELAS